MKYNFSDIEQIGYSYDIIEKSLILLDSALIIKYANSYAKKILGWEKDRWIGASLTEMCKSLNLPNLVNPSTFKVYKTITPLSTCIKTWKLIQILASNQKSFFLTDNDVTETENLHEVLAEKIKKITGQNPPAEKNLLWYTDEIHHCMMSIISQLPGYIYWKDKNFRYIFANERITKSLGFANGDEIIGKTDYDFGWDKATVNDYRKLDEALLQSGKSTLNVEELVTTKDGKQLYLLVNKVPMRNQSGEIIGILGINIDISSKKEAEQLKIESDAALQKEQVKVITFIEKIMTDIQNFRIEKLSEKLGAAKLQITEADKQIRLTKREREVLFFLSLNKPPKDIAMIISMLESKDIRDSTINAMINKKGAAGAQHCSLAA